MLSVIIPAYNEEKDIYECLDSLDEQKGIKFEALVVDDGSTDKTLETIKKYKAKNYILKILHQNHLGAGSARNNASKESKGKILVFVDADMTFDKDFLKKLTHPIKTNTSKGTFSKEEYVSNWDNIWSKCWNFNENWEDKKRHPKDYPSKQKVFRAILKTEFTKVGGFTTGGYTDDWSLSEKLGYLATEAKGAVFYHKNPSSLSEIFRHAQWVGKRKYKLGAVGALATIMRANIFFSVAIALYKSAVHRKLQFIIFKIIYDAGLTLGILKYLITQKGEK